MENQAKGEPSSGSTERQNDIRMEGSNGKSSASSSPMKRSIPCLNLSSFTDSPKRSKDVEVMAIYCPLCDFNDSSVDVVEQHVNNFHFDSPENLIPDDGDCEFSIICPVCETPFENYDLLQVHTESDHSDLFLENVSPVDTCPVCNQCGFTGSEDLALHVDMHFSKSSPCTPVTPGNVDLLLAKEIQKYEKETRKEREKQEFDVLQNQYGMGSKGNYRLQSETNMVRAVEMGKMTMPEYQERQIALKVSERVGVDDGYSCTKNVVSKIARLCEADKTNTFWKTFLANETSHFATTYGDAGWGCGYRNIQMLLTSIVTHPDYRRRLERFCQMSMSDSQENLLFSSSHCGVDMPSVSRIQETIENAWKAGFDVAGQEQLGGSLVDTRKWIGATEVAALLAFHRFRYKLLDFRRPTGPGKTHTALFDWVYNYFSRDLGASSSVKPCLYLQHQGHSRTIVGAEKNTRTGCIRLLILDPGHSKEKMQKMLSEGQRGLKLIRRYLSSLRSDQYQIVAEEGLVENEQEYQRNKTLTSTRIP